MYTLIIFLPLAGAIIAGFFGRSIGSRASEVITSSFLVLAALLSWVAFFDVALGGNARTITLATWFDSGAFEADWAIRLDTLSAVMLVVINSVSSIVHIYSIGYMHEDPHRPRFFAYLSLFTFAMLALVTSDNFLQLFFGWEGVGLASYLLIGFWFKKPSANAAAMKAFVVNRVGDFGLALGIFAIFLVFGSVEFDVVFEQIPEVAGQTFDFLGADRDIVTVIAILLFIGAMGKSAQLFLHTWLPDAMEGPTPVSALIHAATMVTAGVFLVCRCSVIYEYAPAAATMVTVIGASTAFFAATVGLLQDDIKRVIAYSTCSQLGYMFFAAGVGSYDAAMFHLFTHAFFKALLFLCAGCVIHGMHHEQDMKRMGGVFTYMPFTGILMIIGTIAITGVGIPFTHIGTAGFVSKDAILELAYEAGAGGNSAANYAFVLGTMAAAMTSFYSWRLIFLTFYGLPRAPEDVMRHAHDAPPVMLFPLMPLALGALFAGMLFFDNFLGENKVEFWNGAIYGLEAGHHGGESAHGDASHGAEGAHGEAAHGDESHADAAHGAAEKDAAHGDGHAEEAGGHGHNIPDWVFYSPLVMMLLGFAIAAWQYAGPAPREGVLKPGGILYGFLRNKWYFDEIYNALLVKPAFAIGRTLWRIGDGLLIDGLGPNGVAAAVASGAKRIVRLQSGYVYHYAFVMLVGVLIFATVTIIRSGGGQ
ncbi:MAG: NADH-quinone oxidoreductase subunit L [Pseudomonadota bacterium]